MIKNVLESKTVMFNSVTTVIAIAALLASQATFSSIAPYLTLIGGIGNLILRIWFTATPVTNFAAAHAAPPTNFK